MDFFLEPLETSTIFKAVYSLVMLCCCKSSTRPYRTRRKALLELVGLVGVLEDKSVQESVAADLELGLAGLAVTLDPGGYIIIWVSPIHIELSL